MPYIATQIELKFSLAELLLALLVIVGIVVLVLLAKVLLSLSKTMTVLNKVVEDNQENINESLKFLPSISNSADGILKEAKVMVTEVKPNLVSTITEVQGITTNVNKLSGDAVDTVEYVAMTAVDTMDNLTTGVSSATDYIALIKNILESIKSVLK